MSEIPALFSTLSGRLSDLSEEDIHPKMQGHVRVQAAQQTLQEALYMGKGDEDPNDTEAKVA